MRVLHKRNILLSRENNISEIEGDEISPHLVELAFKRPKQRTSFEKAAKFRGLSVESARVSHAAEYTFKWEGLCHYVAVHDMVMSEGEMSVAGGSPLPGGDIRGTLTYLPPSATVSGYSRTVERQNSFTALCFDPDLLSEEIERHFSISSRPPLVYFENRTLEYTLQKIQQLMVDDDYHGSVYAETLGIVAVMELSRLQKTFDINQAPRSGALSRSQEILLRDFIAQHYSQNPSLDELATLVNLSRFHFARSFKVTFGMPPHQYLTEKRVEAARTMLKTTKLSIGEIANAVGFASSDAFIRAFSQSMKVTPGQYRRTTR